MQGSPTPGSSEPRRILPIKSSALPGTHAVPHCKRCTCEDGYLARYIKRNGSVALRWVCDWCECYTTAGDLPHSLLGPFPINELPLRVDREESPEYAIPDCAVCGMPSGEWHHWAPRSIFPDWPDCGLYLCTVHHREWHDRMRAHGLRYPHEIQDAS
jgi:hypothetical protein